VGVSKPCIGHTCMYALAEKMRHILPYRARQCVCMWGIILKEIALGYIVHIRRIGGRGPAGARGPAIKGPWEGGWGRGVLEFMHMTYTDVHREDRSRIPLGRWGRAQTMHVHGDTLPTI
jgi:hypothetical protein